MRAREGLIVFLGPSLPLAEARKRVGPGTSFEPPARQGDVWRVLQRRPRAIALIDGVFESQPSVWHRELLSALEEGVAVFGASSMGALRAAELSTLGMIGVGEIFHRYASGEWNDDSDVALLHADGEHAFRPLTLPLVNVRHAAEVALQQKVLPRAAARKLVTVAGAIFYQERTWTRVLEAALQEPLRGRFAAWIRATDVDLKRKDAEACLAQCDAFLRSGAEAAPVAIPLPSSLVRRRRLLDSSEAGVGARRVLSALTSQGDVSELREAGAAHLLAQTFAEVLGAPQRWVDEAPWRLTDGPDAIEALVFEARRRGRWQQLAKALAPRKAQKKRRRGSG